MDWSSIVQQTLAFLFGGGLVTVVTLRQIRKREDIKNESLAIEPLKATIDQLHEELSRAQDKYNTLEDKYNNAVSKHEDKVASVVTKYEDKCEESATAKSMMCVHLACPLRDPLLGQGDAWLETHKDDISLGVDYTPLNVLMKRLGDKRKREQKDDGEGRDNQGA